MLFLPTLQVVELLLARGANKEHRNVSDYTPLSLAASGGYVNIIKILLNAGAEINSRQVPFSPLLSMAFRGFSDFFTLSRRIFWQWCGANCSIMMWSQPANSFAVGFFPLKVEMKGFDCCQCSFSFHLPLCILLTSFLSHTVFCAREKFLLLSWLAAGLKLPLA